MEVEKVHYCVFVTNATWGEDLQSKLEPFREEVYNDATETWDYNPNGKWDWCEIGGRWHDWLTDKQGEKADQLALGDIDFEAMRIRGMGEQAKIWVMKMEKAKLNQTTPMFYDWNGIPRLEEYIKAANCRALPDAILHEGDWVEEPEIIENLLDNLDPETTIMVVDCHV